MNYGCPLPIHSIDVGEILSENAGNNTENIICAT
jgi:hypothetical protein